MFQNNFKQLAFFQILFSVNCFQMKFYSPKTLYAKVLEAWCGPQECKAIAKNGSGQFSKEKDTSYNFLQNVSNVFEGYYKTLKRILYKMNLIRI